MNQTVNLTATLIAPNFVPGLVLKDADGNENPSVSFSPGDDNQLVLTRGAGQDFNFCGFKIQALGNVGSSGLLQGAAALNKFSVDIEADKITITDKIKDNTSVLNYEYVIFAQLISTGFVMEDDPRIINTTG